MAAKTRSPYELTSGSALDDLHPVLRRYFGVIKPGFRGYGNGVFETVGTPRRAVRLVLRMLSRQGILLPAWEHNVPFTVVNAPLIDRDGRTAIVAVRTFHLLRGEQTMIDAITAENPGADGLVDHLGFDRRLRVRFATRVVRGELHLTSTALELRVGRLHLVVPRSIAPRVSLVERFDDAANQGAGAQRVSVTVDAPLLGRLYEYTGIFDYEVRPEPDRRLPGEDGQAVGTDAASSEGLATRPGHPE